jgi:7-keto-8-aminopelargonate synthetase-like enzyme
VTGPRPWIDLLINRARPFIFSTGLAPASAGAAEAAVDIVDSPEGCALKARLQANIDALRPGHSTPIVPVVVGNGQRALNASKLLLDAGFFVPAIRPPTVPPGTCRLRVSLSAAHDVDDVRRLRQCLDRAGW